MTNSSPPEPPRSSQREPLGFDDFIGILVALLSIGGLLFWLLFHKTQGLVGFVYPFRSPVAQPTQLPSPSPSASPGQQSLVPTPPAATVSPTPVSPTPTVTPTEPTPSPTASAGIRGVIPLPIPAPTQPTNFIDVPQGFWARPFITALSTLGIVNGFNSSYFRPNQPVTRAEFAAILQAAFNQAPGQQVSNFKDVTPDFWANPAIDRAIKDGFLKGYPGDVFRPTQQVSRVQVLTALATGLNLPIPSDPAATLQRYQDAGNISNYAIKQVAAATQAGLVVNYPNQNLLNPNHYASRADVAAMVYQALVHAGKAKPIQSQYIVQP